VLHPPAAGGGVVRDRGGTVTADPEDLGMVEAAEAAVEGVPAAVSLAPTAAAPALGGELLLPGPDVSPDSVRSGLLQAGPLAIAGVVANGAAVVVTVVLARLLTTKGYGQLNVLTGLFLVVSMPGSAVIVAVVRRVTASKGTQVRQWARKMHRRATVAVAVFAVLVVSLGWWLSGVLNQTDIGGVDAILIAGAVWVLLCLDRGLLQAHRNYRALSANLVVEGAVRTVAVLALVVAGFGPVGAAVGILVAELATAVHARVMADRVWAGEVAGDSPATARRAVVVADLVTALVALAMAALLQNIDVIVLGREAPGQSGSYAAVSVASKALVLGAVVLGGYLLPEAAIRWRQGGHALRQLAVTVLLLAVPATALVVVAAAAPHLLLSVVFSSRYLGAQAAFLPLVLAMVCLSVTVMLTMYLLAVGSRWIAVVLVAGAVAATVAVAVAHGAPKATATADLVAQAGLAAVVVAGFLLVHHRRRSVR